MHFSDIHYPLARSADFNHLSPSVHWAELHTTRRAYEYALRRIYDFELLFVKEGAITAHLDQTHMPVNTGQLLFISAGVPHTITVESAPKAVFLGIHFDFFDELEIRFDQDIIVNPAACKQEQFCQEPAIPGFERLSRSPVTDLSIQMIAWMEQVIAEWHERRPGFEKACQGVMQQLLIQLFRMRPESKQNVQPRHEDRIMQLVQWIERHYPEDCSNTKLAQQVNLNEDYMAKQFKAVIGVTPNRYVQSIRLRAAKHLLKETDEPVERIGELVGYSDIYYFSRIFHKWEGISPRKYRHLLRIY